MTRQKNYFNYMYIVIKLLETFNLKNVLDVDLLRNSDYV